MSGPQQIPSLPPPPARQDKAATQRQYREKEGECFNTLKDVIMQLTGEELQTRYEILTKAIHLLSSVLETRRREHVQAIPPVSYDPADTASSYSQESHWERSWQNTDFDAQAAYYEALSHGQHSVPNPDYYGEDWPTNPQI